MATVQQATISKRFFPGSTRLRILGWILIPITLVLVFAWLELRTTLQSQVNDRIEIELLGDAEELRLLAQQSEIAAQDGVAINPQDLVLEFVERSIPHQNEMMFAVIDGRVDSRSIGTPPYRLDQDSDFVSSVSQVTRVQLGETQTSAGLVRYIAIPVIDATSDKSAVLVVAIFADLESSGSTSAMQFLLIVSVLALAGTALLGWFVAGRLLAPIRRMGDTARAISESGLSERIPVRPHRTGDDLDELAHTFNDMFDRLQEAFDSQKEFIDDAGHELRTPLTIVQGHLDLLQYQSDEKERAETLELVEDELVRMARIVGDLQLLTKASSPNFVVSAPIDAGDFIEEILEKARALGERRWVVDSRVEGVLLVDRQRITQAMMQLAANAVHYTSRDQEIGVGLEIESDGVRLWVRDSGSGVSEADRERIFERFFRGSGEKRRDSEGAGLGLTIVKAIALGHGGTVSVSDSPEGGATFRLHLPATCKEGE